MYARISKKGQITIPKAVRQALKVGAEGAVLFLIEDHEVKLKGISGSANKELAGSLKKYAKGYVSLKKIRKKLKGEIASEVAGEGLSD